MGLRVKVEDVLGDAQSECDSRAVPVPQLAFGHSVVEEAGDSVTQHGKLALGSKSGWDVYTPLQ